MKTLFATTAMVLALGLPATTYAESVTSKNAPTTATTVTSTSNITNASTTSGMLATRGQNSLLASDLMGHDVHARRLSDATGSNANSGARNADGTPGLDTMRSADLDGMDNVGEITDLILSRDGTVTAIVVSVGGFLGMGEHDVALSMDTVSFARNADDPDDMYIVVNTPAESFRDAPKFDRSSSMDNARRMAASDGTNGNTNMTTGTLAPGGQHNRAMLTAPSMTRDGYRRVQVSDISIDMLMDETVYGVNDQDVGTIDDVLVDGSGAVQGVVIDFGGFLGMGTSQVSLAFDELTILSNADNDDLRVYVDATKEQIQGMPAYVASN